MPAFDRSTEGGEPGEAGLPAQAFLDGLPDAVLLVDDAGTIRRANLRAAELFGYAEGELDGRPVADLVPEPARERQAAQMARYFRQPWTRRIGERPLPARRRDGSVFPAHIMLAPCALAGRPGVVCSVRAAAPAAAEASSLEERLDVLLDHLPDVFYLLAGVDQPDGGHLALVSRQVELFTGHPRSDFFEQPDLWMMLVHPDDVEAVRALRRRVVATGEPASLEFRVRHSATGRYRWVEDRMVPVGDGGRVVALQGFARDITRRKHHQREMAVVTAASAALRRARSRGEVMAAALDQAQALLEAAGAAVVLRDRHAGDNVIELGRGDLAGSTGVRLPADQGITAQVMVTGVPFHTNEARRETGFARPDLLRQIQAFVCAPLVAEEETIGALWIGRHTLITDDEVRSARLLADIAANAIQRATLLERAVREADALARAYDDTIEGWARALELRDRETEGHSRRVTAMTLELARRLGVPESETPHIRRGAILHDIGKLGVPDAVLLKPGPLTEAERRIVREHPQRAWNLLSGVSYLEPALDIPWCHHERWDGTGYPRGLAGEAIPLAARIFAVADVYDALTHERPYRPARTHADAVAYIREQAGRHFDPRVVEAFLELYGG